MSNQVPMPGISKAFSNLYHFSKSPIPFMNRLQKKHGDFIPLWMGPLRFFFTYRPDHAQHLLQGKQKNYLHSRLIFDKLIPLTGSKGLVQLENPEWKKHRQMTNTSFKPAQIESFVPSICSIVQDYRGLLAKQDAFPICEEMSRLVLQTAAKILFSIDSEEEVRQLTAAFLQANRCCGNRIKSVIHLPTPIPSPNNIRFKRAVRRLDRFAYGAIQSRLQGEEHQDMLSGLMAARDENGESMSVTQLRDHMITFLFAGHETTATSLAWCFYLISQDVEVQEKIQQELEEVLDGREPEHADLAKLKYLTMVYKEALRLYPPAWILARYAVAEDEINGYRIPKNSNLLLSIWEIQRHPEFWPEPDKFKPERFEPESIKKQHRFAFIPFGAGPRICSGTNLALVEAVLILAMFLQKYKVKPISQGTIGVEATITARPMGDIMMKCEPIRPS